MNPLATSGRLLSPQGYFLDKYLIMILRTFIPLPSFRTAYSLSAFAAIFLGQCALSGAAKAQTTYYWSGGSGNWDTTTTDWQTAVIGGTPTAFTSSTTSLARVGDVGAAGTLTLTVPITAQELDIDNTTGYTVAGTSALTLATGNITSNFLAGNAVSAITTVITAPIGGTNLNVSATGTANGVSGTSPGSGNSTVTLSGTNTFTGNLNLGAAGLATAGTAGINRVNVTLAGALPSTANVNFLNTSTSFAVTGGTLTLANNFILNPNNTAGAFVSYIGATSGFTAMISGVISGAGNVTFAAGATGGAGLVALGANNTYTGATTLANSTTGVVRLGVNNALPVGTALTFGDGSTGNNFGALNLNGFNQTVASLATNLATGQTANGITNTSATVSTLTISGAANTTYASVIGIPANVTNLAGATNNEALTFAPANTGVTTLSGANTYSGATTISGGKLRLTNAAGSSATGAGAVVLNGGTTTTLSGSGVSFGLLTVTSGSRLAPGVNTSGTNGNFGVAGTLTVGSGGTLNGGTVAGGANLTNSSLDFDLANTATTAGGGVNDLLTTGGTLTLGTLGVTINELNGSLLTGTPYTLINGAAAETGTPTVSTTYVGGNAYTASYSVSGNNLLVTFAAVPEPSTWAAMLLGLGLLGATHVRRRVRG